MRIIIDEDLAEGRQKEKENLKEIPKERRRRIINKLITRARTLDW